MSLLVLLPGSIVKVVPVLETLSKNCTRRKSITILGHKQDGKTSSQKWKKIA